MASITELLRGLMEELTREQDGTTHPEPLHHRELCRWEDEKHIYSKPTWTRISDRLSTSASIEVVLSSG